MGLIHLMANKNCQRCNSDRILVMSARCCDQFFAKIKDHRYEGIVLDGLGLSGGEYVGFDLCLECGQVQGEFPLPRHDLEEGKLTESKGTPFLEALSTDFLKDLLGIKND